MTELGRILAVDDNLVNLKVVSATLAQIGYEVYTAESGPEALALHAAHPLDGLVVDLDQRRAVAPRGVQGGHQAAGGGAGHVFDLDAVFFQHLDDTDVGKPARRAAVYSIRTMVGRTNPS